MGYSQPTTPRKARQTSRQLYFLIEDLPYAKGKVLYRVNQLYLIMQHTRTPVAQVYIHAVVNRDFAVSVNYTHNSVVRLPIGTCPGFLHKPLSGVVRTTVVFFFCSNQVTNLSFCFFLDTGTPTAIATLRNQLYRTPTLFFRLHSDPQPKPDNSGPYAVLRLPKLHPLRIRYGSMRGLLRTAYVRRINVPYPAVLRYVGNAVLL